MTFTKKHSQNKVNNSIDINKNMVHIIKTGKSGKEITCLGGTIWITQTGDGVDRILTCGDIYQTRIAGQIIIQAMDTATIKATSMNKVEVLGNFPSRVQPQLACA